MTAGAMEMETAVNEPRVLREFNEAAAAQEDNSFVWNDGCADRCVFDSGI